jgi:hypothetical protein
MVNASDWKSRHCWPRVLRPNQGQAVIFVNTHCLAIVGPIKIRERFNKLIASNINSYNKACYITDIDECLMSPCFNNATCTNTPGGFYCTCVDAWAGPICSLGEKY